MRFGVRPTNVLEWIALAAKKVPIPIVDVIIGPLQGRALIAAERAGVLRALGEKPQATAALAKSLSLDEETLGLVLRVLRAMGYLRLESGEWSLSATGRRYFGAAAPEPYHAFVEYGDAQWKMITELDRVLKSGRGIDFHSKQTPEEWNAYQRAMVENASAFAWFVAENLPVAAGATRCLDVAGAHGLVGAALCEKYPGMTSTVLDLPQALKTSVPRKNVTFKEGNLLSDDFGSGFDVVLLCNILHHFSPEQNVAILEKAHHALGPKGVVGIFDLEIPAPDGPPEAGADGFALFFRVTSTSACFRGDDYERWLAKAGFQSSQVIRSIKMPSRMLVVGKR